MSALRMLVDTFKVPGFTRYVWLLVAAFVVASVLDAATFLAMAGCATCVELNVLPSALSGVGPVWPIVFKAVATAYVIFCARAQKRPSWRRAVLILGTVAWLVGAASNLAAMGLLRAPL